MARDFFIPGEAMVYVRGPSGSLISGNGNELGLAEDQISVSPKLKFKDINVNAWGSDQVPVDVQRFLAWVDIAINFVHFDRAFLDECLRLAMGGSSTINVGNTAVGRLGRTGSRMGAGLARFAAGNNLVSLGISSPVGSPARPWRFWHCHLSDTPIEIPIGTERSVMAVSFRAVPYTVDPWGTPLAATQPYTTAGTGSNDAILWDHPANPFVGVFD